ncbi:MAG: Na+/H+ antiporter subunit B [Chloroflexota bacterium]
MISSLILKTATRYLVPTILMFSIFIFLRGHNEPGGGFIGGLLASSAFVLYIFAFSIQDARALLRVNPLSLIGAGLSLAMGSTLFAPIFFQETFMKGIWGEVELPGLGKLGSPFFFDLGVELTVLGVVLTIIFTLAGEDEKLRK